MIKNIALIIKYLILIAGMKIGYKVRSGLDSLACKIISLRYH